MRSPGSARARVNSMRYVVDHATLTQAASWKLSQEGLAITLRVGTTVYSAKEPGRSSEISERFGSNADRDLHVGLQLTHSGRYARPDAYDRAAPIAACANPVLDRRFPGGVRVFTDAELDVLVDDFVAAARLAQDAGFAFVDVKACHGYLGHELLGARTRPGP